MDAINKKILLSKMIEEALGDQIKDVDVEIYDSDVRDGNRAYIFRKSASLAALIVYFEPEKEKLIVQQFNKPDIEISLTDPDSIAKLGVEIKTIVNAPSFYGRDVYTGLPRGD